MEHGYPLRIRRMRDEARDQLPPVFGIRRTFVSRRLRIGPLQQIDPASQEELRSGAGLGMRGPAFGIVVAATQGVRSAIVHTQPDKPE